MVQVLPGQLVHAGFDGRQIVAGEGLRPQEVVIEAVFHGRSDAGLRAGEEVQDGVRQQVGGAVPQDLQLGRGGRGLGLVLFIAHFCLPFDPPQR
jgi:hypothetical protein